MIRLNPVEISLVHPSLYESRERESPLDISKHRLVVVNNIEHAFSEPNIMDVAETSPGALLTASSNVFRFVWR